MITALVHEPKRSSNFFQYQKNIFKAILDLICYKSVDMTDLHWKVAPFIAFLSKLHTG